MSPSTSTSSGPGILPSTGSFYQTSFLGVSSNTAGTFQSQSLCPSCFSAWNGFLLRLVWLISSLLKCHPAQEAFLATSPLPFLFCWVILQNKFITFWYSKTYLLICLYLSSTLECKLNERRDFHCIHHSILSTALQTTHCRCWKVCAEWRHEWI